VTVRVGQAVNTIGLAGIRHGISGVRPIHDCLLASLIISVPNASNASQDRHGRARRAWHQRVLPVPERTGGPRYPEKVSRRSVRACSAHLADTVASGMRATTLKTCRPERDRSH
jgi:hypothetical protein